MRKKSYHPFYKVTILCEIIVRVRVRVTVSMLSVSVLSVFSRYFVRVFQITVRVNMHSISSTACLKKKGYPLRLGSQTLMQHVRDRMF